MIKGSKFKRKVDRNYSIPEMVSSGRYKTVYGGKQ